MTLRGYRTQSYSFFVLLGLLFILNVSLSSQAYNPNPPPSPVKLIFIHHSCGENWLSDSDGRLGRFLRDNNYFVSDTNYGWGPDSIGDLTDIGHWWTWFQGPNSATYLNALYNESGQHSAYSRRQTDPGGENVIILFKSCYPNSFLGGNPNDLPTTGNNPLRGQDCYSNHHKVAHAKGIYKDLLNYFATRQDKLFVVITAPPQVVGDTDTSHAANARAFNNWLVNNWLENYSHNNVAVFDFYNVLTSNGGDAWTNDSGQAAGNHHRYWNSDVQHKKDVNSNVSAYPSAADDSHPTYAGNQKATDEFVELLNIFYHCWKGTGGCVWDNVDGNEPPVVDSFAANPSSGQAPLAVNFICTAHDPDGQIANFRWDRNGDGQTDRTTTAGATTFTYSTPGTFTAVCTVVDNDGATTTSESITISVRSGKKVPIKR